MSLAIAIVCRWIVAGIVGCFILWFLALLAIEYYREKRRIRDRKTDALLRRGMRLLKTQDDWRVRRAKYNDQVGG